MRAAQADLLKLFAPGWPHEFFLTASIPAFLRWSLCRSKKSPCVSCAEERNAEMKSTLCVAFLSKHGGYAGVNARLYLCGRVGLPYSRELPLNLRFLCKTFSSRRKKRKSPGSFFFVRFLILAAAPLRHGRNISPG